RTGWAAPEALSTELLLARPTAQLTRVAEACRVPFAMPTCHAAVRPPSIGLAASTLGRNSSRRRGIQRRSLVPGAPRLTLPYRLSLLRSRVKARTVESQRAGTGLGVQGLSQCVLSSRNAPLGELGHETPTHGVHADGTFPLRWSQHDGGLLGLAPDRRTPQ